MTTINIDSNRNISLAEIREHQPYARYIVRIDRNLFGLIDTDEELAEYKKTHKGCKVEKNCKRDDDVRKFPIDVEIEVTVEAHTYEEAVEKVKSGLKGRYAKDAKFAFAASRVDK